MVVSFCIQVGNDDVKYTLCLSFPEPMDGDVSPIIMVNILKGLWGGIVWMGSGSGRGGRSGQCGDHGVSRGDKWFIANMVLWEGLEGKIFDLIFYKVVSAQNECWRAPQPTHRH